MSIPWSIASAIGRGAGRPGAPAPLHFSIGTVVSSIGRMRKGNFVKIVVWVVVIGMVVSTLGLGALTLFGR